MLDENLPTFFIKPFTDASVQSTAVYLSQQGNDAQPAYVLRRPDPALETSKNCYAVGLFDAYNPDVLYGEVVIRPQWTQPPAPSVQTRRNGNGSGINSGTSGTTNGVSSPPLASPPAAVAAAAPQPAEAALPADFTLHLYAPDQQVHVRYRQGTWGVGPAQWEFELPKATFRQPSASDLDRSRDDPAAADATPRYLFRWKRDGALSKDLMCQLAGRSSDSHVGGGGSSGGGGGGGLGLGLGMRRKRGGGGGGGGGGASEPDITVALFKHQRELTIYETNMSRIELEDPKGLELVLLLSAAVIRDLWFGNAREALNMPATVKLRERATSRANAITTATTTTAAAAANTTAAAAAPSSASSPTAAASQTSAYPPDVKHRPASPQAAPPYESNVKPRITTAVPAAVPAPVPSPPAAVPATYYAAPIPAPATTYYAAPLPASAAFPAATAYYATPVPAAAAAPTAAMPPILAPVLPANAAAHVVPPPHAASAHVPQHASPPAGARPNNNNSSSTPAAPAAGKTKKADVRLIKKLMDEEAKEARRRQAEVDRETERLRKLYGAEEKKAAKQVQKEQRELQLLQQQQQKEQQKQQQKKQKEQQKERPKRHSSVQAAPPRPTPLPLHGPAHSAPAPLSHAPPHAQTPYMHEALDRVPPLPSASVAGHGAGGRPLHGHAAVVVPDSSGSGGGGGSSSSPQKKKSLWNLRSWSDGAVKLNKKKSAAVL